MENKNNRIYPEPILMEELDKYLQKDAEKYGFKDHKEKSIYTNTHMSGWYAKNSGKSCLDKEFLDQYFADKEKYLAEVEALGSLLLFIEEFNIGGTVIR